MALQTVGYIILDTIHPSLGSININISQRYKTEGAWFAYKPRIDWNFQIRSVRSMKMWGMSNAVEKLRIGRKEL